MAILGTVLGSRLLAVLAGRLIRLEKMGSCQPIQSNIA